MNKKQVLATASVAVLLFSAIAGLQFVRLATANFLPPPPPTVKVYIRNDGSVDPETTPIQRFGNVYVFTDNLLNHTLEVQCDNIVVDGASFTLKGVGVNAGITLSGRSNVTIKNIDIRNYVMSVWLNMSSNNTITSNRMLTFFNVILDSSSNNQITGNDITGQDTGYGYGVQVNSGSSNNTIVGNTFTDTGIGVRVEGGDYNLISGNYFIRGGTSVLARGYCNVISKNSMVDGRGGISVTGPGSYNTIFGNNITGKSKCGIKIYWGSSNTVYENHVANSAIGVKLGFDYEFPDRKVENNVFYHNNFVNNTQYVFIGYTPNSNFWDNGKEGNYWSNYNGTDSNGDGIGDTPYIINADNQDNYPLMEPVVILVIEIPEIPDGEKPTTLPTDPSPTSQLPPSPPFIAMPEEYINYTISRVNGSLWAKIDGTYPLYVSYEKSGSDLVSKLDDTSLLVTSDELPMFYPTPPGTTNISVKMNETELNWSNHTKTHPEATHHTAIGDWPMICCTIHPVPDHFILKIHYEHPIILINGSYTFLYDLNISPYLSPWCNKSTAYFKIRMETKYEDLHVYTTGSEEWSPVDYTLTKKNTAEIVNIKIISEYNKPLLGDLAVTFTDAKASSPVEYSYSIIAVIGIAIAFVAGYQFLKRIDMRFNDKYVRALVFHTLPLFWCMWGLKFNPTNQRRR